MEQTAFQIHPEDNVATALAALTAGAARLLGDAARESARVAEDIPNGHKVALRDIRAGETIVKYGVPIGCATADIAEGTWVHLHNMRSLYDERSSHLDAVTGAPRDAVYE